MPSSSSLGAMPIRPAGTAESWRSFQLSAEFLVQSACATSLTRTLLKSSDREPPSGLSSPFSCGLLQLDDALAGRGLLRGAHSGSPAAAETTPMAFSVAMAALRRVAYHAVQQLLWIQVWPPSASIGSSTSLARWAWRQ